MAKRLRLRAERHPKEPLPPKTVWDVRLKSEITLREALIATIAIEVITAIFSGFYWWWVSVRNDRVIDERDIDGIPFGIAVYIVISVPIVLMMRRAYLNNLAEFKKLSSPDTPQPKKPPRRLE